MGVSTCAAFVSSHRARHVFCRAAIGGLLRRETAYQIFKKKQKLGGDETSDFKQKMSPAGQQHSFLLIKVLFFSTFKEKQPLQHHKQAESVLICSICAPAVLYISINIHFYFKFLRHSTSFTWLRLLKQMALGIWQASVWCTDSIQIIEYAQYLTLNEPNLGCTKRFKALLLYDALTE